MGEVLPYQLANVTDSVNDSLRDDYAAPYHVDKSFTIVPKLPSKFYFDNLQLMSNVAAKQNNFDDLLTDEFFCGASWIIDNYVIGAAIFVDNRDLDDHAGVGETSYPEYFEINKKFRNKLVFQISYKKLTEYQLIGKRENGDLSLYFSFDKMLDFINLDC
ncbi:MULTISPECIES: hypothetical protein [Lactobacillus]|uniref:hypothetical protein n=1 Tax=Lactobacillus TaxID=1578 RepID=UPI00261029C5|nr:MULTISPECIES: hypothetical protein [Lactobacillus]